MIAPNTVLRDRYRIIHELGHGGMGAVYQAMDGNLNCLVAVKETFAANDEQRRAFRREAELLANLSHPTLPRVMDHFTDGEGQFLVMQFVPGHDLAELLELKEQPFPVAKVLDWADQVLDALEELHSSSPPIIHRDIKPANLKVTPKGRVLLLDFGLAKGSAGQMSTVGMGSYGRSIYGYTPNYAPIEQIRGAGTDSRSDLYSLAATMWTLLTAKVPPDALSRLAEKEEGHPDPLRPADELNPHVPAVVSAAVDRALAVNRKQRYATAAELREALLEARDAEFESQTQPIVDAPPEESPTARPVKPTIKAPEPEPSQSAKRSGPAAPAFRPQNPNIELVRISPGSFMMGATNGEEDEKPVHLVTISYPFYMGKYQVTQAQWQSVMGYNPSNFKDCVNCPVEQVSWEDTQKFIQRLNGMNDGYAYRLPTEAEWEYACRAGTMWEYAGKPGEMAWYSENSENRTHAVGGKQPNAWGLADMHGNVWERCQDWYHETYHGSPTDGSAWLSGGGMKYRVLRGGSWNAIATNLRSAGRNGYGSPVIRGKGVGFRVVAVR